jgi:plastocyanin
MIPFSRKFCVWCTSFTIYACTLLAFIAAATLPVRAQGISWYTNVGAETNDEAKQADAFLPNEVWIVAGDSITWTFVPVNEIHTVTFLAPNQVRPAAGTGCPGTTASGSSFDGSTCVNSGPLSNRATYTVTFPTAGNYKLVCLVHKDMYGVVHVLPTSATVPYTQAFYEAQAFDEARDLLNDGDDAIEEARDFDSRHNTVLMRGEIAATAGGRQYVSIVRFLPGTIRIHAGQMIEWMNTDPTEPHTVTFGSASGTSNTTTAARRRFPRPAPNPPSTACSPAPPPPDSPPCWRAISRQRNSSPPAGPSG